MYSVLHRVPKSLKLSQQPRRQHGQTVGADEERQYQHDNAVLHRIREQHDHVEEAKHTTGNRQHYGDLFFKSR